MARALDKLKQDISFAANQSNCFANNNPTEFAILRSLNINLRFKNSPKIREKIWHPPIIGWLKVNTDGAAQDSPGLAGGGGIFRDHLGKFVACFAAFYDIQHAIYAELLSVILAVELAHAKGWHHLWIESDSTLVVDILIGNIQPPWSIASRWSICQSLLSSMSWKVSHIFREGNSCADLLANHSLRSRTFTWWNSIPLIIFWDCNRVWLGLPSYRFTNL